MKTIPPQDPTPATGRLYWRGLDELAETPEFKQFLEREFPQGASELTDPVSRRHFVKIMSASFALAGIGLGSAGCRKPEDQLMPFGKAEENFVHGTSQYFATACRRAREQCRWLRSRMKAARSSWKAIPFILAQTVERTVTFRPRFSTLYDPDRAQGITKAGAIVKPEEGFAFLDSSGEEVCGQRRRRPLCCCRAKNFPIPCAAATGHRKEVS
jgi:molybdopterin-containing oxidoreductase family iron-sulfur binding subunit